MNIPNMAYIATHISLVYKDSTIDDFGIGALTKLLGEPPTSENNMEWWFRAEAKIRIMKAKALFDELNKYNAT